MSLTGRRVVITRAAHQAEVFARMLRSRGAEPLHYPCIDILPPEDTAPLVQAICSLAAYDWLVITSGDSVHSIDQQLTELDLEIPDSLRVAAIGPATAHEADELLGVETHIIPDAHTAEALALHLIAHTRPDAHILLPQSEIARPDLAQHLADAGRIVDVVTAYRTVIGKGGVDLPRLLVDGTVDALTFTSTSTVQQFLNRFSDNGGDHDLLTEVVTACIGPVTAEAAHRNGFRNILVPEDYTLSGLLFTLEGFFE